MGLESFQKNTNGQSPEQPKTAGKMDFVSMAENLNPDLNRLEQEFSKLVQKVAAIKEQMRGGRYMGKLTDLPNTEAERDALKKQIEAHPDFGSRRQGIEKNMTGRDGRMNRRN